jgi:hypothetical protein
VVVTRGIAREIFVLNETAGANFFPSSSCSEVVFEERPGNLLPATARGAGRSQE